MPETPQHQEHTHEHTETVTTTHSTDIIDAPVPPVLPPEPFTQRTIITERSDKWLAPAAIALGLLFIIGGIIFLSYNRNRPVANLPEYTPDFITPVTSSSPSTTPTPTISAVPVVELPTANPSATVSTANNGANGGTKGGVATASQPKKTAQVKGTTTNANLPVYQPQSSLPAYTPNQSSSNLPAYTPTELPAYQPQQSAPSPAAKQTIKVSLSVDIAGTDQDRDYIIEVARGATVLDVLKAAQTKGFSFRSEYFASYGSEMVKEINGKAESGSQFWVYTVNGKFASKGISLQTVNEFDVILWSLT